MFIGREKEFEQLEGLLLDALYPKKSGSQLAVYISGKPGTGKTMTVRKVIEKLQSDVIAKSNKKRKQAHTFGYVYVNCVSCDTVSKLYKEIRSELDVKATRAVEKAVEDAFEKSPQRLIIVLDELDYLGGQNEKARTDLLYRVLGWPSRFNGNVVVIGIANTMDLIAKSKLPKLTTRPKCITFKPYTPPQIADIIKNKHANVDIDSKGIELIARKVAKEVGDVRKALDIAEQTISEMKANEAAELREALQRTVQPAEAPSTPKKQRGCREALAVMNRVSASPLARARLTLHQRIILAIILDLSNTGDQHVDRKRIYGEYAKVYAKLNLAEPTIGEVVDTISALVSNSMIAVPQKPKNVISMLVDPDTAKEVISSGDYGNMILSVSGMV
ncbi:Protein CDC-6 [Aphelenchoides avenae]|nr:Protein CDC-6 [Aphelenchus avenae]